MLWVTWDDVKFLVMCEDHMQIRCHFSPRGKGLEHLWILFSVWGAGLFGTNSPGFYERNVRKALWTLIEGCGFPAPPSRFLGQQVLKEHWFSICETEDSQPCSTRMENGGWLLAVSWARDRMSVPCNSGWHDNIQTETENVTFSCSWRWKWVGCLHVSLLLFCIEQSSRLFIENKNLETGEISQPLWAPSTL